MENGEWKPDSYWVENKQLTFHSRLPLLAFGFHLSAFSFALSAFSLNLVWILIVLFIINFVN